MCKNEKSSCITINCGCCGNDGETAPGGDSSPVGTILAFMGTKAPDRYLVCDGSELNIADYPLLTGQIQKEFGVLNYFGGDGVITFAVPDLRNEFLRGYHGESEKILSGEIGKHQEATEIPTIWRGNTSDPSLCTYDSNATLQFAKADDEIVGNPSKTGLIIRGLSVYKTDYQVVKYTSRPENVAVLYCIKYE